jgi:hypothetical protein
LRCRLRFRGPLLLAGSHAAELEWFWRARSCDILSLLLQVKDKKQSDAAAVPQTADQVGKVHFSPILSGLLFPGEQVLHHLDLHLGFRR